MLSISDLIEQVRDYLMQTDGQPPRQEVYSHFINECKNLNLTEDVFYKDVLKPASKSIDWDALEIEKKNKAEQEKRDQEQAAKQAAQQTVLVYIYREIKALFDTGVVKAEDLKRVFEKAQTSDQDIYQLADYIDTQVEKYGFKPFPAPDASLTVFDVKGKLLSTNWYDGWHYNKMAAAAQVQPQTPTSQPVPPPVSKPQPAPPKKSSFDTSFLTIITVILLAGSGLFYLLWWRPYAKEKNAPRMYIYANSVALRSSPSSVTQTNILQPLEYGTEVLIYNKMNDWSQGKAYGTEGYVYNNYLLDKKSFYELNSIFADTATKNVIAKAKYRKALLHYFHQRNIIGKMDDALQKELFETVQQKEIWQVVAREKPIQPNTFFYPSIKDTAGNLQPKGFAFLVVHQATQKRKLVLYAFTNTDEPQFVYEEEAPDSGNILSITRNYFSDRPYIVRYSRY